MLSIPLASTPFKGKEFPSSVDLSIYFPNAGDQGMQNSCVAWTLGYALKAYQEKLETNQSLDFSPAFIYNQINKGYDRGSFFEDALKILENQGVCTKKDMPYNPTDFLTQPTIEQKSRAKKYKIEYWKRLVSKNNLFKSHLNQGYPIAIGVRVDDGFKAINQYDKQCIWKKRIGNIGGGHAILIVGYDDKLNAFKILNSWGTTWGINGYAWIDYSFLISICDFGFIAKDAKNPESNDEIVTIDPVRPNPRKIISVITNAPVGNTLIPVFPTEAELAANEVRVKEMTDSMAKAGPSKEFKAEMEEFKKEYTRLLKINPTLALEYLKEWTTKKQKEAEKMFTENPVGFSTGEVKYNDYDSTYKSNGIRIFGNVIVPVGRGDIFNVVTKYYDAVTNTEIKSLIDPQYADGVGFAASTTNTHPIEKLINSNDLPKFKNKAEQDIFFKNWGKNLEQKFNWSIAIPYKAFDIKKGAIVNKKYTPITTKLYAIATAFVDGFGVISGEKIYFTVTQ
jgi:Papain family cysteine protease